MPQLVSVFSGRDLYSQDRFLNTLQAALLCVAISILLGAAVLITEFVKKMQVV